MLLEVSGSSATGCLLSSLQVLLEVLLEVSGSSATGCLLSSMERQQKQQQEQEGNESRGFKERFGIS